ncbi:MAG: hydroxyacylglutathione hydrolase [Candidatus Muproteobacteria bacterium RBG_16_64_10]|uniref:Hydroxyacylglutathione hydrolase n=1 Tax=Candidatus Muproteobacteria bacterium RBG_16_64_10 TaxID=1817757 RepID=A0A1F6T5Z2_9PROT|nr:MAG: hydroxyacylglutathione hydrolase [Candidatus Muproteobacteria bacterium RBG_16_64_10]
MSPVLHVRAFEDNYIWLVRGQSADRVAIVDPGDAAPVLDALATQHLTPVAILCTHHHGDHVGGVEELRACYDVPVYGPAQERIPALTHRVQGGERVRLDALGLEFDVLDVPGHTAGHIAYYGASLLFCGDTLFSAGCGRLFEGTAEQLHDSLSRLAALPPDTAVYCGHEYTAANLRFALTVEPDNPDTRRHQERVRELRAHNELTLPSTIGRERRINPFLRSAEPRVRRAVAAWAGREPASDTETFALLRRWKDGF